MNLNCLDIQLASAMYYLYDFRQLTQTFCASVFAFVKWENNCTYLIGEVNKLRLLV